MFLRVEPKARAFDAPSSFLSSCMAACIHSLAKRSNRDRNSRDCSCPRQPDVVAHKMLKVRLGHHGHATRREPESSSRSARRPETTRHLLVDSTVVVAPLPSSFSLIVEARLVSSISRCWCAKTVPTQIASKYPRLGQYRPSSLAESEAPPLSLGVDSTFPQPFPQSA
jgi:hypothetical protein